MNVMSFEENEMDKEDSTIIMLMMCVLMAISAYFIADYFQFQYEPGMRVLLFFFLFFSKKIMKGKAVKTIEKVCFGVFSIGIGISMVLAYHIHVEDAYYGLIEQNYIMPYTKLDFIAFLFMVPGIYTLLMTLYVVLRDLPWKNKEVCFSNQKINKKMWFLASALIFVLWIPYLLAYWPGFIFGDSFISIAQGLGVVAWNNHHPIMYSYFIKICLDLGRMLGGGNTLGVAIYSIIQMIYMSSCFGYMIAWIVTRAELKRYWVFLLSITYGGSAYIATYGVSMWKDCIFSATLVVVSLLFADLILTKGKIVRENKLWIPISVFFLLVTIFCRNNGIYIVFFLCFLILILLVFDAKQQERKYYFRVLCTVMMILIGSKFITGPVYESKGLLGSKAESVGVFLNQMARVAAYDGDMSKEDREYMDSILPIDLYKTTYRPCCTDKLKWDEKFNDEALEKDFFKHWISMFIRNPKVYFEAWEMQTYGFWAINRPEINRCAWNLSAGVPRNTTEQGIYELSTYDIHAKNLFETEQARIFFPQDEWSIPLGMIHMGLIFLVMYLILRRREMMIVSLAPSIGLFITLVIASPIYYWPRYGAAEQFLIPFYLILLLKI